MSDDKKLEAATFANGCFWCTEAVFQQLKGVEKVSSGYSGGHVKKPSYEQVCNKDTGHAESLQIQYNPSKITYDELLEVFWKIHDPTKLNRQGNDVGPQYRSAVFYHDEIQKEKAEKYKKALNESGIFDGPIVTTIEPLTVFYPAEDYHANYYNRHKSQSYCHFIIKPKIEKLHKLFANKLREQ